MTELPDEAEITRLGALAEDPLIRPSVRVEARKVLKAWQRVQENARDRELRQRLAATIRTGRDGILSALERSWRGTGRGGFPR